MIPSFLTEHWKCDTIEMGKTGWLKFFWGGDEKFSFDSLDVLSGELDMGWR